MLIFFKNLSRIFKSVKAHFQTFYHNYLNISIILLQREICILFISVSILGVLIEASQRHTPMSITAIFIEKLVIGAST